MDEMSYLGGFIFGINVAGVGRERMSHDEVISVLKQIRDGEITLTPSAEETAIGMELETGRKVPDELMEFLRQSTTGDGRRRTQKHHAEAAVRLLDKLDNTSAT